MDSFSEKFSEKIMKFSEQKHLKSIKLGIISAMPLLQVLGLFIFIVNLLFILKISFSENNINMLLLCYSIINFVFFICLAYGVSSNLASMYELDRVKGGFIGILASITILAVQYIVYGASSVTIYDFMLLVYLPTIVISILVIEIFRLVSKIKIRIKESENVPTAAIAYMNDIIPIILVVLIIGLASVMTSFEWITILNNCMTYFMKFFGSFIGMVIVVTITSLFWMYGVHGVTIIGAIARPFWIQMIIINTFNFINGTASPYIANEIFYQWFIWIGGSGCTLGLVLLMKYTARSSYLRMLGKDNLITSLFNINESIIFGTPIALNKKMMKPFLIVPLICGSISWLAIKNGLVTVPFILAPWVLPAPIGAFIATAGDFRAIILCLVLILISMITYYPFLRLYDKELLIEEQQ